MKTRIIELSVDNRKEVIELPVNPAEVKFNEPQLNQAKTLLNVGEANLPGERGLKHTELSSFFPSEKSPFWRYAKMRPEKYVALLQGWKRSKKIIRVIISDMGINLAMLMDDFEYFMKEGDGDVYYRIPLSEYRDLNVSAVQSSTVIQNNGLLARPALAMAAGIRAVCLGDTLWGMAKQTYGSGAEFTKIYEANSTVIEKAAKSMGKPNSQKGYYLYPGTMLTLLE